ncbi:unnamed protein product, partial [Ectocarpus sp. 8 AP-2014]
VEGACRDKTAPTENTGAEAAVLEKAAVARRLFPPRLFFRLDKVSLLTCLPLGCRAGEVR